MSGPLTSDLTQRNPHIYHRAQLYVVQRPLRSFCIYSKATYGRYSYYPMLDTLCVPINHSFTTFNRTNEYQDVVVYRFHLLMHNPAVRSTILCENTSSILCNRRQRVFGARDCACAAQGDHSTPTCREFGSSRSCQG
jgi:hypothetical protein